MDGKNLVNVEKGKHALNTLWENLKGRDHLENADV
jgi:hypothetical protein